MFNVRIIKVLISLSILFLGGIIYLGWRSGNLVMFQLLEQCGMIDILIPIRELGNTYSLFDWMLYSMPDGLWLFSYMFIIDAIWNNHKNILRLLFLWSLPIIAIMSELLQYVSIIPGTFDIVDLLCYIFAVIIFLLLKLI